MKLALVFSIVLFFLFILPAKSQSQKEPFLMGHTELLTSKILGGDKTLIVSLPDKYESGSETYPLIIYLDGFLTAKINDATHDVHKFAQFVPDAILVGIEPIDRVNHYAPWKTERFHTAGGADTYIKFIDEELIPYLNSNYRTQDYRIIIGGSLGGLFVLHTLLSKPDLFDCYLAVSPSCWYHNNQLIENAKVFFNSEKDFSKKYVFLSVANEGLGMGVDAFADVLRESNTNINWDFKHYPEEVHFSASYKSVGDGLRFFYKDWRHDNIPLIEPMGDVMLEGNSVEVNLSSKENDLIKYTLDGSEPTGKSNTYSEPITIDKNTILKTAIFYKDGKLGPVNSTTYKVEGYHEAVAGLPELEIGLKYDYYEGKWTENPDLNKFEKIKSGECSSFNIGHNLENHFFGFNFSGYINIPEDGKYTFYLSSDDDSQLSVANVLLVSNVFDGYNAVEKQANIFLKAGMHPINVKYYQKKYGRRLSVMYESDGIEKQEIAGTNLFRIKD